MLITETAELDKKRISVSIDGSFSFWFYQRDYRNYGILREFQPGKEIGQEVLDEVFEKLLFPRAKETALCFLERSDRSEQEIRKKLKEKQFPEVLFDKVADYLREYHYLDEERMIRSYLACHSETKSRRAILLKLKEKGLSEELVAGIMAEEEYKTDTAVCRTLEKKLKGKNRDELTWKDRQKINAYLYRKGFTGSEINHAWQRIG
jgi:regulatory protein